MLNCLLDIRFMAGRFILSQVRVVQRDIDCVDAAGGVVFWGKQHQRVGLFSRNWTIVMFC